MQAGFTVAQFNRITNHNGKKTLTRCLALVLGISGSGSDENPDVNLIVFNQAKANALGGPDWHNAFDRLSVKHQDHADVTDGKETMFYSDVLTLYSEEDVRLHEDVLAPEQVTPPTAPSAADLDAVAKEQEVAKATAGESSPGESLTTASPEEQAPTPESSDPTASSTPSPEPLNEQSATAGS